MLKRFLTAFSLLTLVVLAAPLASRGERIADGAIRITADTLSNEASSDTFDAAGKVEVRWDGATLTSDRVSVRSGESVAVAEGDVVLHRDDSVLKGDRLTVNYATEQGEAENADLFIGRGNFHLRGRRIAKAGENDYRVERGSFTTCDGLLPSWQFTAADLEMTVDGFAEGKHAVFYVGSFPVFYTPYILFPVKQERQSGFLFPRIGSSTKKGFSLDVPYYWAVSPSQDVTFDIDVETKRGVGAGAEYRFLGAEDRRGNLRGFFIYDREIEKVRGDLVAQQDLLLAPTLSFKTDLHLVLDRSFFLDYAETAGEYNRQLLDSSISLSKQWESTVVSAETRYFKDLYAPTNAGVLQRLPILRGDLVGRRLGPLPLYASLSAEYTHFEREVGLEGERVDLHPTVALFTDAGTPFRFSLWGGYRERLYHAYAAIAVPDQGFGGLAGGGQALAGKGSQGLAEGGGSASTSLDRVYGVAWGDVQRVKHTLMPELSYTFVEEKGQERLPFFDFNDRIPGGSLLTWSMTNFLAAKVAHDGAPPEYRELLYLRLSGGYQVSGARRIFIPVKGEESSTTELLNPTDEGRRFTDLRLETRLTPWKRFSVSTDSRLNPYEARFSLASVTAEAGDPAGSSLGLGYHYLRDSVDYLEAKLGVDLVKPFVFHYTGRYALDGGKFLESYYALEYKHQCWSVTFTFRDRLDNKEFMVNFALAGIGALGPVKAF